jgi:hypothetical protein
MEHFIGCDAHKKFSVFVAVNEKGQAGEALRVAHDRELYRDFLARLPPHSTIAVEASGSYSWLVDEMERSGHRPKLCNPLEAKRRMALTKKTDKLDAKGLAILLRNGTLPEVGFRRPNSAINANCCGCASFWFTIARASRTASMARSRATIFRYREQICSASQLVWNWAPVCRNYRSIAGRPLNKNWQR